jgi:molybdopterin converting factor small subunit
MAKIFLHSVIKELAGRSEIDVSLDRPTSLGEVLRSNFSERELFLIIDETGAVRRHVNIFANGARLRDTETPIEPGTPIDIFPAVSGG